MGISQRPRRKRKPKPEREAVSPALRARNQQMRGLRTLGADIAELATRYGLSKSRVHQIVAGVDVLIPRPKPTPKSRRRPERAEKFRQLRTIAVDLRKRGYSYRQIALQVGVGVSTAYNWTNRVLVRSLEGSAWLDRTGRPKAWRKSLPA